MIGIIKTQLDMDADTKTRANIETAEKKIPNIIAFSGVAGHGKDTAALFIMEYLRSKNIEFQHLKFADKLKQVLSRMFDLPLRDMYTLEGKAIYIKELNQTIGRLHQTVGDAMKTIDPKIWIYPVTKEFNPDIITIISDCRFPLEAEAIKEADGIIIRLERDQEKLAEKEGSNILQKTGRNLDHNSEVMLNDYRDFDYVIKNNSTKEALKQELYKVLGFK